MSCRVFFDTNSGNKDKCKLLMRLDVDELARWEREVCSAYSPGAVADDEVVYQQIVDPTHIAPDGAGLKPTAFDACSSIGLSTNRLRHSSWRLLVERGVHRADAFNAANPVRPPRSLWGFAPYPVGAVRRIISNSTGTRGFFVYDTALADDASHADICQGAQDQRSERSVRFALYDLVKGALIPLSAVNE